jgi:3-phenylpropionate/trans-cinnamate dioxygenase ferredoxin reductase component
MAEHHYEYLIIGAGLAGASAVEGIREVDARMEIITDREKPHDTGTIYYASAGKIRGMIMCNVWDKIGSAREMIRQARPGG